MAATTRSDNVYEAIEKLQRLTDVFRRRRGQIARHVGVTEQQWRVLEGISSEHFIPSMFAREKQSTAAAVSKVLRQLIDKDLVSVRISSSDGRQRHYDLTVAGRRTMKRLRQHRLHAIDAVWGDFSAKSLLQFQRFTEQLIERIETYASDRS